MHNHYLLDADSSNITVRNKSKYPDATSHTLNTINIYNQRLVMAKIDVWPWVILYSDD